MKHLNQAILYAALAVFLFGCQNTKQQPVTDGPGTDREKISYAIGVDIAQSIENISDEIDLSMLQKGMADHLQGKELLVSEDEVLPLLQALSERLMIKQQGDIFRAGQKNLEEGLAFLSENKTREGIITTESGLQYKVLKEGTGKFPEISDMVMVHYRGSKLDGTVFDSSYERGEPAVFQIDQVIRGWAEGIQLMKEGSTYNLFIPSDLAYGERGAGQQIGPNEVLVFEVELLEVLQFQPSESSGTQGE